MRIHSICLSPLDDSGPKSPGAQELSIARAAKCITTLCVASRSGSCLIRHEQQQSQGRKTQMSLVRPSPSLANRVISTFSFDPKPLPSPQNLH